jgi:hypothetical protein
VEGITALVVQLRHQAKETLVVLVALTVELLLVGKVVAVAVRVRLELRRHQMLLVTAALAYLLQSQVHLRSMLAAAAVGHTI